MQTWLTDPMDDATAPILMEAYYTQTGNVQAVINLHVKQRGGIHETALQTASCLTKR